MYHEINETAARRAKEANSFRDYVEGSATAAYRAAVDKAKDLAEQCKAAVDPMYHDKIDSHLERYAAKLAANINKGLEIDGRVPSIMIAGGSNFPTAKKEKQNAARDRNMQEWEEIQGILEKMKSVGAGGISGDDPNAIDKLNAELEGLQAKQDKMKKANAHWRKHGTMSGFADLTDEQVAQIDERMKTAYSWVQKNGPYEDFKLTNNNAKIKRIQKRIEELSRHAESTYEGWKFDGGEVVINRDNNRLQIVFEEKPDEDLRAELKKNGFKWAPSQSAWQRQLTDNAMYSIKRIKAVTNTA